MRRLEPRAHFVQHFDEAVNRIGGPTLRRSQTPYGVKRAIRVSVPVNDQQSIHKFARGGIFTPGFAIALGKRMAQL
jgi:hypothetical protein